MPDPIADVQSFHLAIPSVYGGPAPRGAAQWPQIELVLVRVETKFGIVGWGEAFGHRACTTTEAALRTLAAPAALGLDGDDITGSGEALRRTLFTYGLDGPIGFALSGIDIALWDIAGQRVGQPVCDLIARGAARSVPTYASLLRYGDVDLVALAAADAVGRGHRGVKLHEATFGATAAARAAVGNGIALSLDVNCRWSVDEAVAMAQRMEHLALDWIEEPCWPPDPAALAWVAEASRTPVAAGENAGSLEELERISTVGRAAYLQPSAAKLGGITGLLAARDLAARLKVKLAAHSAYFGPGLAATAHFCAAQGLPCEWYDCRLEASPSGYAPIAGQISIPDAPGLGVAIDPHLIDTYRVSL